MNKKDSIAKNYLASKMLEQEHEQEGYHSSMQLSWDLAKNLLAGKMLYAIYEGE